MKILDKVPNPMAKVVASKKKVFNNLKILR